MFYFLFFLYACGLSSLLSLYVLMCVLEYVLVFVLNDFEFSILVGSMCSWEASKGLCVVIYLCILVVA